MQGHDYVYIRSGVFYGGDTQPALERALAAVVKDSVEALVLTSDASMTTRRKDILRFALAHRLPTIVDAPWTEQMGEVQPLLGYWPLFHLLMQQAAPYVDKILWHGARPGDLPIQLPARFQFMVNQQTARAIGVTVPQSVLLRADEVVQ